MDKEKIRERLVELLAEQCRYKKMKCVGCDPEGKYYFPKCKTEQFGEVADHLIANGVTFAETDGCGYCDVAKAYNDFPFINKNAEVDKWTMMGKRLKYCPMCGRQLPEPPKENDNA